MLRKFAIVQRPGYHDWCADDVVAEIKRRMLNEKLTPKDIEEIADKMDCRVVWAGPMAKSGSFKIWLQFGNRCT